MVVEVKRNDNLLNGMSTPNKVLIHNVHIIDASGSMYPAKYREAIEGVNSELAVLEKTEDELGVEYTNTIVEFGDAGNIHFECFMQPTSSTPKSLRYNTSRGMTALYDAVGQAIQKIRAKKNPEDRVLIKILTDGQENNSREYSQAAIRSLIKQVEGENFTITGMSTQEDLQGFLNLGISQKNMMVHNNTASDIKMRSAMRTGATVMYSKSMAGGASVTTDFFAQSELDPLKDPKKTLTKKPEKLK